MKRCLLLLSIVLVLANADHDLLGCLSERDQFVTKDVTGLELDLAPGKMTCEEFLVYGNSQGYFAYAYCLTNPDFKRVCCNTCKKYSKGIKCLDSLPSCPHAAYLCSSDFDLANQPIHKTCARTCRTCPSDNDPILCETGGSELCENNSTCYDTESPKRNSLFGFACLCKQGYRGFYCDQPDLDFAPILTYEKTTRIQDEPSIDVDLAFVSKSTISLDNSTNYKMAEESLDITQSQIDSSSTVVASSTTPTSSKLIDKIDFSNITTTKVSELLNLLKSSKSSLEINTTSKSEARNNIPVNTTELPSDLEVKIHSKTIPTTTKVSTSSTLTTTNGSTTDSMTSSSVRTTRQVFKTLTETTIGLSTTNQSVLDEDHEFDVTAEIQSMSTMPLTTTVSSTARSTLANSVKETKLLDVLLTDQIAISTTEQYETWPYEEVTDSIPPSDSENSLVVKLCDPNPCQNQATCSQVGLTSIQCSCPAQFTGYLCQYSNPCIKQNPCLNNSTCFITGFQESELTASYKCLCSGSYMGKHCEIDSLTRCTLSSCHNGGTCQFNLVTNKLSCLCIPLFTGPRCEQIFNPCWRLDGSSVCLNNGICRINLSLPSFHECQCKPGYIGSHCEYSATTIIAGSSRSGIQMARMKVCEDKDPEMCSYYAKNNFCSSMFFLEHENQNIHEYCAKSCNQCDPYNCQDTQSSCAVWAAMNLCPTLAHLNPNPCPKSCNAACD